MSSWTLPDVQLSYTGTVGGQQVTDKLIMLDMDEVYAPTHLSYHCTSRKWAAKNSNDSMDATSLELPGFQVRTAAAVSVVGSGQASVALWRDGLTGAAHSQL